MLILRIRAGLRVFLLSHPTILEVFPLSQVLVISSSLWRSQLPSSRNQFLRWMFTHMRVLFCMSMELKWIVSIFLRKSWLSWLIIRAGVNHNTQCIETLQVPVWKRVTLIGSSYLKGSSLLVAVEVHPGATTGGAEDFQAIVIPIAQGRSYHVPLNHRRNESNGWCHSDKQYWNDH